MDEIIAVILGFALAVFIMMMVAVAGIVVFRWLYNCKHVLKKVDPAKMGISNWFGPNYINPFKQYVRYDCIITSELSGDGLGTDLLKMINSSMKASNRHLRIVGFGIVDHTWRSSRMFYICISMGRQTDPIKAMDDFGPIGSLKFNIVSIQRVA